MVDLNSYESKEEEKVDLVEKVKSQTSQRYEDVQNEEEVLQNQDNGQLDANEKNEDEDEGDLLDLKEQTTKGAHLNSELDGQLQSMTGTMRNIP